MQAIDEWHLDPKRSYLVGDKNSDIEPGRKLGMTTLLVETGYGKEEKSATRADYVAADVVSAVDHILRLHAASKRSG